MKRSIEEEFESRYHVDIFYRKQLIGDVVFFRISKSGNNEIVDNNLLKYDTQLISDNIFAFNEKDRKIFNFDKECIAQIRALVINDIKNCIVMNICGRKIELFRDYDGYDSHGHVNYLRKKIHELLSSNINITRGDDARSRARLINDDLKINLESKVSPVNPEIFEQPTSIPVPSAPPINDPYSSTGSRCSAPELPPPPYSSN